MSEESKKKVTFKFTDQVIGQIRELLQMSLITGTNIVDNLRTLELEVSDKHPTRLQLSVEYCNGWNALVQKMEKDAVEKQEQQQKVMVEPEGPQSGPPEGMTHVGEYGGFKLAIPNSALKKN